MLIIKIKNRVSIPPLQWFAILLITIAFLISGYWSQILHWVPCSLCWVERILLFFILIANLFPISLVVKRLLLLEILSGVVVGGYHSFLQLTDGTSDVCAINHPCGIPDFRYGFITPATLVTGLFFALFVLTVFYRIERRRIIWRELV